MGSSFRIKLSRDLGRSCEKAASGRTSQKLALAYIKEGGERELNALELSGKLNYQVSSAFSFEVDAYILTGGDQYREWGIERGTWHHCLTV